MRQSYDKQLNTLNIELIKMGSLCEEPIATLANNFDVDSTFVKRVNDVEIQSAQKAREIENICMRLLLRQQPVASDLRYISSSLKIIYDFQRIATQLSNVAEIAAGVDIKGTQVPRVINQMANSASQIFSTSIDALSKLDVELCAYVINYDDVVDNLFIKVKAELINLLSEDNKNAECYLDLLMIAKYFEKIADHSVNVAKYVEYMITGETK